MLTSATKLNLFRRNGLFNPFQSTFSKQTLRNKRFFSEQAAEYRLVQPAFRKSALVWLGVSTGCVLGIVLVGGFTRLTRSGLSMTEWSLQGSRLPSNEQEWQTEFAKYKATPEFERVHSFLSLDEFKFIYFNEWFHRQCGRAIGLVFGGGLAYFMLKKAFTPIMTRRMGIALILGGAQGLIGWWMVKSGLQDDTLVHKNDPRVSPYRLATHLGLAGGLFSFLLWNTLDVYKNNLPTLKPSTAMQALRTFKTPAISLFTISAITFLSGALVAGNDAGRAYNTWPKMLDHYCPPEVARDKEVMGTRAYFESTPVVQFNHRMLAYTTFFTSLGLSVYARKVTDKAVQWALRLPFKVVCVQLLLGISTLLTFVPTGLGVLHQAGGMSVLGACVYAMHTLLRYIRI